MNKSVVLLLLPVFFLVGCAGPASRPIQPLGGDMVPPRVAVASFENRTGFEGQWKLGPGMADLLVSELVGSRNFVVLERVQLGHVVDEISRQRHGMFRREGKVDEGRLDNAQYLIRGVITDFSQTGGGTLWMGMRRLLIGGGGYTARVGLTLTIVHIETGTIVDSVQSSGRARARQAYAQAEYKGIQFGGSAFFQTPLGEATAEAIREGLRGITRRMPRERWEPMIADVQGTRVVVNGGRRRGLRVGHQYQVRGSGQTVTDPRTGDLLDVLPGPVVGTVEIVEVRDALSIAERVSGHVLERGQTLERIRASSRLSEPL
jgi:curli biogenesis system outer membrane secretion channel CsgG